MAKFFIQSIQNKLYFQKIQILLPLENNRTRIKGFIFAFILVTGILLVSMPLGSIAAYATSDNTFPPFEGKSPIGYHLEDKSTICIFDKPVSPTGTSNNPSSNPQLDNCPFVSDPNQKGSDGDGLGDVCDPDQTDYDGDSVPDAKDNCVAVSNDQRDTDGDKMGAACDPDQVDKDEDGIVDAKDNCPAVPNSGQSDFDGNKKGDACDADSLARDRDRDGITDGYDNCPTTPSPNLRDTDNDGTGTLATLIPMATLTVTKYQT